MEKIPSDELNEIESNYENGMYKELSDCLEEFLKAHAKEIPGFKKGVEKKFKRSFLMEEAVNLFILNHRIINLNLDLRDQQKEIEKEQYYRGERHEDTDLETVALEWTRNYGGLWRLHRTREVIYVFRRENGKYMNVVYEGMI
ncbi:hypothetical protein GOV06_00350 [Candidatus Woesearchaeota archaeon]|nr:hypothetical protein [Candidatus Woesearchaeota archaeon]